METMSLRSYRGISARQFVGTPRRMAVMPTLSYLAAILIMVCYAAGAGASEVAYFGNWIRVTSVNRFTDETSTSYALTSSSIITTESSGSLAATRTATLYVHCGVFWSVTLDPEPVLFQPLISLRFDKMPRWQFLNPYDITYASFPGEISFIRNFATASLLTIGIYSSVSGYVVMEFNLHGGKEVGEDYLKSCNSK